VFAPHHLGAVPHSQNNVFAGCSNGDVYLSFNGLSTSPGWLKVDTWTTSAGAFGLPDAAINAIAHSPKDIKTAYLALSKPEDSRGVWGLGPQTR